MEEILQERLDTFYVRRTTFDRSFGDGESFRYGALNVEGLGTPDYGDYCAVLRVEFLEGTERVAYLKSDSLKAYMKADDTIDESQLRSETAPHSHRHVFASLKHAPDLGSTTEADWPKLLCSNNGFIEVVFLADLAPSGVESVRLETNRYKQLFCAGSA